MGINIQISVILYWKELSIKDGWKYEGDFVNGQAGRSRKPHRARVAPEGTLNSISFPTKQ